ncbi:unnamed protein product [Trichogramma brassicae]|uniref:Uncharacterized protein n=1 Tax=Trichogramma brassicae TaxID=86971 RepID=A0A6H5J4E0_9HYME|nr:unnamed protein product [Trichogramma brassicae]
MSFIPPSWWLPQSTNATVVELDTTDNEEEEEEEEEASAARRPALVQDTHRPARRGLFDDEPMLSDDNCRGAESASSRFVVVREAARYYKRFRLRGTQLTIRFVQPPAGRNWLLHMEESFEELHAHLSSLGAPNDYIGVTISSDSLTNGNLWLSFRPIRDFTVQDLWTVFFNAAQSNENFSTENTLAVVPNNSGSVVLAAFTTAQARLILYESLARMNTRVLYYDTDSIIYVSREGEPDLPTGSMLGQLTDELAGYGAGTYISSFVSGCPKFYAFKYVKPNDEDGPGLPFGAARQRLASWEARNALPEKKTIFFSNGIASATAAAAAAAAIAATASAAVGVAAVANMSMPWIHPWTSMLSGPTGCGKTFFVKKFLNDLDRMSDTRFELYYLEWQPAIASCSTISGSGNSSARSWNFARVCHKARTRPICSQYYLCDERKSPVWPQKCHRVDGPVPSQSRGACGALEEGQSSPRKDDLRVRAERFGGQRQPDEKPQDTFEKTRQSFAKNFATRSSTGAQKTDNRSTRWFLAGAARPPAGKRTGRHTEQPTFESMKQKKKKKVNEKK